MKTLAIVLGIAVAMVTVPAWAASPKSLHAMSQIATASALSSDELSAVEGGVLVTLGPSATQNVPATSISTFLTIVLAQQYGLGGAAYPLFVTNTTVQPGITPGGAISFLPVHNIRPNTLVCSVCSAP